MCSLHFACKYAIVLKWNDSHFFYYQLNFLFIFHSVCVYSQCSYKLAHCCLLQSSNIFDIICHMLVVNVVFGGCESQTRMRTRKKREKRNTNSWRRFKRNRYSKWIVSKLIAFIYGKPHRILFVTVLPRRFDGCRFILFYVTFFLCRLSSSSIRIVALSLFLFLTARGDRGIFIKHFRFFFIDTHTLWNNETAGVSHQ